MSRRTQKRILSLVILLVSLFIALGQQYHWFDTAQQKAAQNQPGLYPVKQFFDGDTFSVMMNGTEEKIRLIGVDTPETHDPRKPVQCFGAVASEFTKTLVGKQQLRLEADPLDTNRDRYGRLLRYAYLPDGRTVNGELIRQGYGFAYLGFPFSKQEEFRAYQDEARNNQRGLWATCTPELNVNGGYTSNPQ